jgi:dephospho-CoA kinase
MGRANQRALFKLDWLIAMLIIGLTGGIGCGKTTVARLFAELAVPIIDADEISRQLVAKGQSALFEIQQVFGAGILNLDGTLNRKTLREIVFANPKQKHQLEAILHPRVYQAIEMQIKQLTAPYCIICIPLLFETNKTDAVTRILVIDCPEAIQMQRVKSRDDLPEEMIQSIIDSQVPRTVRLNRADDIIDNSGSDAGLAEQVKKLHNLYLSISHCVG